MPDWLEYKGIEVPDATPTGAAGLRLKDDLQSLIDWNPKSVWDATTDPTVDDDVTQDLYPGSMWLNVTDSLLFLCLDNATGAAEWIPVPIGPIPDSEVWVHTGNGFGSTNINFRRFTTTLVATGTAITYADSATLGATFTINESGFYVASWSDVNNSNVVGLAISKNYATSTYPPSVPIANRLILGAISAVGVMSSVTTAPFRCTAGDVIRAVMGGPAGAGTSDITSFRIVKSSN